MELPLLLFETHNIIYTQYIQLFPNEWIKYKHFRPFELIIGIKKAWYDAHLIIFLIKIVLKTILVWLSSSYSCKSRQYTLLYIILCYTRQGNFNFIHLILINNDDLSVVRRMASVKRGWGVFWSKRWHGNIYDKGPRIHCCGGVRIRVDARIWGTTLWVYFLEWRRFVADCFLGTLWNAGAQ